MPHPNGGSGKAFPVRNSFRNIIAKVGTAGIRFTSTTNEEIIATHSTASDANIQTINFEGVNGRIGNVCEACWGFRLNCSGTRVGQYSEALDAL